MFKVFIFHSFLLFLSLPSSAGQRVSLRELLQTLPPQAEITKAYRQSEIEPQKIKAWWKSSEKTWQQFHTLVKDSAGFVRGEIEQESTISALTAWMQLSILQCRAEIQQKQPKPCAPLASTWFHFVGDLAYEESSLVALRLSTLLRSLWMDELEAHRDPEFLSSMQDWIWSISAPWPVDRVLLAEGRKVLHPSNVKIVEKVAQDFQKNPYQTAEQMLKKIPGKKPEETEFIKKIWRQEDLDAMKTEIHRLNKLRVQAAQARFLENQKKPATSFEDLIQAKLMTAVPIDYLTGRKMDWVQ